MEEQQDGKQNEQKPVDAKPTIDTSQTPNTSVTPPKFDTIQRSLIPDANVKSPHFVQFSEGYDRNAGKPNVEGNKVVTTVPLKGVPGKNDSEAKKD